jgi:hypothetical protein
MRDRVKPASPPWLQTGNGEKFMYTLELFGDLLLEKCNQAQKIRMPGQGSVTQLPYLSADRLLVQGPAETNAAFITRLQHAFAAWKKAGSRIAVAQQAQAYLENEQPGVSGVLPEFAIVSGNSTVTTWSTQYIGDAIGAPPTLMTVPANWNWDGSYKPWRSWFILYMSSIATGLSGTGGTVSGTTDAGSYVNADGTFGQNVGGVWVPLTSGSVVNHPFIELTGLSGLTPAQVGQWIVWSGAAHAGNNGTFPIVSVTGSSTCYVANPANVPSDANPGTWSIVEYPYIGPGPVWDAPGYVWDQGASSYAPPDYGTNVGGVWQPTTVTGVTSQPSISWGLDCSSLVITSIRQLLQRWKSGTTWYSEIIVAFDGGTGAAGSSFSSNSTPTTGNPNGTYGGFGQLVAGVWVPNRNAQSSLLDAYCQGSGSWNQCTVQNVT